MNADRSSQLSADERATIRTCVIDAFPHLVALYLYGSMARGDGRNESDVDLAILAPAGQQIDALVLLGVRSDLSRRLRRDVDLTVLDAARSTVLAKEVVTGGVVLVDVDPAARAHFEMMTLSLYARFCEDRRPVMAAYASEAADG